MSQAGVDVAWQIEIDEFRRKVLARHWPEVVRHADITKVTGDELEDVDLLFGGFPCQDLSYAGQRAGIEKGKRSSLFFEFARLAGILQPRWLLIENVPGLLSSYEGQDMGFVIETLSELGYGLSWRVLDSQYFGVPQRRRRVYIVGCLGRPCPPAVLFERQGRSGDPTPGQTQEQEVANPLGASTSSFSGRRNDLDNETYIPELAYGLPASNRGTGDGHGNAWNSTYIVRTDNTSSNGWGIDEDGKSYGIRQGQPPVLAIEDVAGKQSGDGRVGIGVREGAMYSPQRGHQHAVAFSENQRGETVLTDYSHQLTSGGGKPGQGYPAVLVGEDDPNLVVDAVGRAEPPHPSGSESGTGEEGGREEWSDSPDHPNLLVGEETHPDGVREATGDAGSLDVSLPCVCKDAARYAACGDAVTVNVARWIGTRLTVVDELMKEGVL